MTHPLMHVRLRTDASSLIYGESEQWTIDVRTGFSAHCLLRKEINVKQGAQSGWMNCHHLMVDPQQGLWGRVKFT